MAEYKRMENEIWRKTDQYLMPTNKEVSAKGMYDLYPTLKMEDGKITEGFESLAKEIARHKTVIIDGYIGVFFDHFRIELDQELEKLGKTVCWHNVAQALKPEDEINRMIEPFLGGDDPIFGTRTTLQLADFFDPKKLQEIKSCGLRVAGCEEKGNAKITQELLILYGCGAALAGLDGWH